MFDLKQLQCFVAVGEELHFGRAAKRMYMTQPPLSRQIQLLEHELQIQLFIRTNRSVKLTPAGRVFLQEARRLLALAETAASSAQRIARGESGLLKLGFTGGSSYRFLPKMLAYTNAALKNINIVLHEMMTRNQIEALHAHTIDISLLRLTSPPSNLEFACVAREALMLAVPRGHRFATGRMPTLKDLGGEPFITFHPVDGRYFYELIERLFKNAAVPTHFVQRVGQIHSILALVSAGQGIALVPESARALQFNGTIIRKIKMDPVYGELFLAWKADNGNPALPPFRKIVLKQFALKPSREA
jgi:DNA-binding transcriptional LysR family regulator